MDELFEEFEEYGIFIKTTEMDDDDRLRPSYQDQRTAHSWAEAAEAAMQQELHQAELDAIWEMASQEG